MDVEFWVLKGHDVQTTVRMHIPSWWDYATQLDALRVKYPKRTIKTLQYGTNGVVEIAND